ncbi:aflatoxin B1 aldehyde reductase member 2 [Trichoderma gamsii]|uniref:Aflatoxin B1 aldehyde reductase member 2 n=1 Tax=Trichoderma gamsii TaxID=398673 RepID=A0A2P4ZCU0_9HYPO|nr:aflatoxin B1 aldehyde reductase member 2 [Trichoderma gamsii]PON22081.1 aflatoxin B1 aldehyde reductase member 2 [Trichoderma gamsii]
MAKYPPKIIFGSGNVGDSKRDPVVRFDTQEQLKAVFDAFYARGHRQIDSAQGYSVHAPGSCEPRLGEAKAGDRFLLDTKVLSDTAGSHKRETILKAIDVSLERLKVKQLNILYLHQRDRTVPFEETCEALNQAYTEGKFRYWGISNLSVEEVTQLIQICDENKWVRPSVYQGHYNPIVRGAEKDLFPALRKYGMSFYAYSPAAAGFFAGNHKNARPGGRYDASTWLGDWYAQKYNQPGVQAATEKALATATAHGIGGHDAALRWCAHHSALTGEAGDGIILGAGSLSQLETNMDSIEAGPLPQDVVAALDDVYQRIAKTDVEIVYHW